eukprot:TRINITY_DN26379_c0_g1_i1.p1 TRINITY_DN26379_c0_g1~~TRINITY_DN26379_c0_g1_i1.p1  ORF type:complete len:727 (-),score=266.76 TRINITY_DN26379_c0_g1_i1:98-2278(-)
MEGDDVVGIIHPPPAIKTVLETTAGFVAKNGPSFEKKILEGRQDNPKFQFLHSDNPYHAYYLNRVKQIRDGITEEVEESSESEVEDEQPMEGEVSKPADNVMKKKEIIDVLSQLKLEANREREKKPFPFKFVINHPTRIDRRQLEVIKLVAQYTAVNGRSFMHSVASQHKHNDLFTFLQPNQELFQYYVALVELYKEVQNPSEDLLHFIHESKDKDKALKMCIQRATHLQYVEDRRKREKEETEADRLAFQMIDWHDFVVVETITFDDNMTASAPQTTKVVPPPPAAPVARAPKAPEAPKKPVVEAVPPPPEMEEEDEDMDMDDDMDMDMDDERPPQPPSANDVRSADHLLGGTTREVRRTEDLPLNIKEDYEARPVVRRAQGVTHFKDQSGQEVPVNQASDHMRVELIDPQWAEQKRKEEEKAAITPYTTDGQAAQYLHRLAAKRADVFGGDETKKRQVEETDRPVWDGITAGLDVMEKAKQMPAVPTPSIPAGKLVSQPAKPAPPMLPPPRAAREPLPPTRSQKPGPSSNTVTLKNTPSTGFQQPPLKVPAFQPPQGNMPVRPPMNMMQQPRGMIHPQQPRGPPRGMVPPPQMPMPGMPRGPVGGMGMPRPPSAPMAPRPPMMTPQPPMAPAQSNISINVRVPMEPSMQQYHLNGQLLSLKLTTSATAGQIKGMLAPLLGGLPFSKMQLKSPNGFMKDALAISQFGVGNGTEIQLTLRTRGGKK